MGLGFTTQKNITVETFKELGNVTDYSDLAIGVNNTIYDGTLYFFILLTLTIILFITYQKKENYPVTHLMYATTITGVLAVILRAIYIWKDGVAIGLITDPLTWVFPIISIIMILVSYSSRS